MISANEGSSRAWAVVVGGRDDDGRFGVRKQRAGNDAKADSAANRGHHRHAGLFDRDAHSYPNRSTGRPVAAADANGTLAGPEPAD